MGELTTVQIWKAFESAPPIDKSTRRRYKRGYCDDWPLYADVVKQGRVLDLEDRLLTSAYFTWMTDLVHVNTAPCLLNYMLISQQLVKKYIEPRAACPSWLSSAITYTDTAGDFLVSTEIELTFFDFF